MKKYFLMKNSSVFLSTIVAVLFFATAPHIFALSYSPATIYYQTPYTLSESVSNSSGSDILVTKDCYYWKNAEYGGMWGHEVITVPTSGTTATCSSTGDIAGTQMSFQMNIWRPDYNGSVSYTTTSFTVSALPVATASITGTSPISYNTAAYLTFSSSYANSCSVSGGGGWYTHDANYTSGTWLTPSITSNTTFTVSCIGTSPAINNPSANFTVVVNPPPKIDQTITGFSPTSKTFGDSDFTVSATASSALTPVTFVSQTTGVCATSGTNGATVHLVSAGTCTILASQAGNQTYNAVATSKDISVASPSYNISASAGSGGSVSCSGCGTAVASGATVTVTANFSVQTFSVTGTSDGSGSGTVSGGGTYNYGDSATLTASPTTGSDFTGWTSCSGTVSGNTCTFSNITSAQSATANFSVQTGGGTTATIYYCKSLEYVPPGNSQWTTRYYECSTDQNFTVN